MDDNSDVVDKLTFALKSLEMLKSEKESTEEKYNLYKRITVLIMICICMCLIMIAKELFSLIK